ncbi:MAG: CHAT domain-containing protein [Leptolyngbya sp. SIO3F4]|nr:CHAT domain-containing protein [Leptolyngbya sp. SIO3F4]
MCNLLRHLLVRPLLRLLFISGLALSLLLGQFLSTAIAQTPQPIQLVQDGVTAYRSGYYTQAIDLWSQSLQLYPTDAHADRAMVHENLARTYQHIGETQTAISSWEAAGKHYQASDNSQRFGRTLTEQAQVYITLGQQQRAAALLCGDTPEVLENPAAISCPGGAYAIAETTQDPIGQATALGSLAETYRLRGEYETAESILTIGLAIVQNHGDLAQYRAPMLNTLGNVYARWSRLKQRRSEAASLLGIDNQKDPVSQRLKTEAETLRDSALETFTSAISAAQGQTNTAAEMRSHLSLVSLYRGDTTAADSQNRLAELIPQLPDSRETAYAAITLAKSFHTTAQNFACTDYRTYPQVKPWLETGLQIAERIQDDRAKSFALGELGHLAECQQNWPEAVRLTNQAQLSASNALESTDSLYLWEWQMGRIHKQQNQISQAIASYKKSINTLEGIRTSILTANRDLQFDFRDTVAPIYRQYIELQLTSTPVAQTTKQFSPNFSPNIDETLQTVDSLRLAELQNFFGDNCVLVASENARDRLLADDPQTTIITSVVLSDRTALIANLPDGTAKTFWVGDTGTLKTEASRFRRNLKRFTDLSYDKSSSEALYKQLILPLAPDLERTQTQTLVFIQDSFLRNIPMSALYDGEHYLVEKYAVATTPALSLTAPRSRNRDFKALAVGLDLEVVTESGRPFDDLDAVKGELAAISTQLPGSKTLLNEEFTVDRFKAALQETRYSILHLATHGQFSTVPEETFVITGPNASGVAEEITFEQLETLISDSSINNEPLDLITLTACQTATGDERATLGLAGVAIQAGARSAVASLWNLPDKTAAVLIPQFYSYLRDPSVSKAQALQQAQIDAIVNEPNGNPGKWAPLVLVGNWQ